MSQLGEITEWPRTYDFIPIEPPIGPPNRLVSDLSRLTRYAWTSQAQRDAYPELLAEEKASMARQSWRGRWQRFLALIAAVLLTSACQANLGVSKSQPVPETAHQVTKTEGDVTTVSTEYAMKTTCSGLQWSVAAGATMCGESSEWADEAWEVLKEFGRLARGLLPAGFSNEATEGE